MEGPLHEQPFYRAKREQLGRVEGLSPESQGQNLILTVLFVASRWTVVQNFHERPFVGVSEARSWSYWLGFVEDCRQKLTNLLEIGF